MSTQTQDQTQAQTQDQTKKGRSRKATVTTSQGRYIHDQIMNDRKSTHFKSSQLKKRVIFHANKFCKLHPDDAKPITVLKKSTYYDLLKLYRIPTVNKKSKNKETPHLNESDDNEEPDSYEVEKNNVSIPNQSQSTGISSNSKSKDSTYTEFNEHSTDLEILQNDEESPAFNPITSNTHEGRSGSYDHEESTSTNQANQGQVQAISEFPNGGPYNTLIQSEPDFQENSISEQSGNVLVQPSSLVGWFKSFGLDWKPSRKRFDFVDQAISYADALPEFGGTCSLDLARLEDQTTMNLLKDLSLPYFS